MLIDEKLNMVRRPKKLNKKHHTDVNIIALKQLKFVIIWTVFLNA